MKKFIIIIAFFLMATPLFAQTIPENLQSEFHVFTFQVERVFSHRAGFIVMYRIGNRMATAYLPLEWFTAAAGKGEVLNLPRGNAWPSMSVFYRNGEFSHVRLSVHPALSHPTWGFLPQTANIDYRFENVETIDLRF